MSYVEDNLMSNEKVLFFGKISPAIFLRPVFALVICIVLYFNAVKQMNSANQINQFFGGLVFLSSIACFLIMFFLIIQAIVVKRTSEFAVTSRRVISKTGFVRRNTTELLLIKIESVGVSQNVLGRVFKFGTIKIHGTGGTHQRVTLISDPVMIRNKMNRVLERLHSQSNRKPN